MKVFVAALLSARFACCVLIDIDHQVDSELDAINLFNKYNNDTTISIPGDSINENVSYSNGYLTSLGTLHRTDNCSLYTSEDNQYLSYDLHIGLKFFATLFGKIAISGRDAAAYFQVDDNSLHFGVTYTNRSICTVALYALALERFKKVKFSVSDSEFDKFDFESLFRTEIHKKVNWILAKYTPIIQFVFQKGLCNNMSNGQIPILRRILLLIQNLFKYTNK